MSGWYIVFDSSEPDPYIVTNSASRSIRIECRTLKEAGNFVCWLNGGDELRKRERFAMAAMQGCLASDASHEWMTDELAKHSIKQADALIAELEKQS